MVVLGEENGNDQESEENEKMDLDSIHRDLLGVVRCRAVPAVSDGR
jgi:hypothetical protein